MSKHTVAALRWVALAGALFVWCPGVQAQSPYGLAARQTIPFVIQETQQPPGGGQVVVRSTEINLHNPGSQPITVTLTYFGAFQTATPGQVACNPQTVSGHATAEFSLGFACSSLNPGLNFGRLELSTLAAGGTEDPAGLVFLSNARVSGLGSYFTVEGFPQGNLSGNRNFAVVTGLKSGVLGASQWRTDCFGAALNESVPMFIRLVDANGNPLGSNAGAFLDPPSKFESVDFQDIFTAVGAPPGNYANVTALFSTSQQGAGQGGPAMLGLCRIVNLTSGQEAFEVAKYLDNNDEGRQHVTAVKDTAYGAGLFVINEVAPNDLAGESNLHVAYFQHPDRVKCRVDVASSSLPFFDVIQMRLIDPDHVVVVNPFFEFTFDLGEKSTRHNGRDGRWLVEVGPRRARIGCATNGSGLCQGGLEATGYVLTCSSGNGHNQLDVIGHCLMSCPKDPQQKKYALCDFDMPFIPKRCGIGSVIR